MLLLNCRLDQVLRIGHDVQVRVIRTHGGTAILAITAPPAWRIRRELVDQKPAPAGCMLHEDRAIGRESPERTD